MRAPLESVSRVRVSLTVTMAQANERPRSV
jgi:hypothetical protein